MRIVPRLAARRLAKSPKLYLRGTGLNKGFVIYSGADRRMVTPSIELVPWHTVAQGGLELPL